MTHDTDLSYCSTTVRYSDMDMIVSYVVVSYSYSMYRNYYTRVLHIPGHVYYVYRIAQWLPLHLDADVAIALSQRKSSGPEARATATSHPVV